MKYLIVFSVLVLAACTKGQGISLKPYGLEGQTPQSFQVCHGFSCSSRTDVQFSEAQWQAVLSAFSPAAETAAQERTQIANAIARIEKTVVAVTGLAPDHGQATTFEGDQHQMDCIDEAVNTSRYLGFLEDAGVLRFNAAYDPVHRGYFVDGMWPHNSGAVRELGTDAIYVIDSYYHDNGEQVDVVPLDIWLDHWTPAVLAE